MEAMHNGQACVSSSRSNFKSLLVCERRKPAGFYIRLFTDIACIILTEGIPLIRTPCGDVGHTLIPIFASELGVRCRVFHQKTKRICRETEVVIDHSPSGNRTPVSRARY